MVRVAEQPLRDALLAQVRDEAVRTLARADEEAGTRRREAEQHGRALVAQARAEGVAAAGLAGVHGEARSRHRARRLVLEARRELYDEVERQARAAAQTLRDRPGYARLLERLSALAREQLGDEAVLEVDPPDVGGVRASSGGRHVDYTLDALVRRCLSQKQHELDGLWT